MNYLLYGSETYRLKKKLDELLKANDPENTGMNTVVYEAGNADFQLRAVLEDAWTIPFFAEKKTVVAADLRSKQRQLDQLLMEAFQIKRQPLHQLVHRLARQDQLVR